MSKKMKIAFLTVGSAKEVADLEKRLGFDLPTDYKNFLAQFNGAVINDGEFFVKGLNEQILMDVLFGINLDNRELDLEFWHKEYEGEIPEKSLIIGMDPGGGDILLINDGVENGIYYYDHSYFFSQSSDELNTYYIADSFTDFLSMMENEKLNEESRESTGD